jgi:hypothetical protein
MKVIEFETIIRRGLIHVPSFYKSLKNIQAKVIVMIDETNETKNYNKALLLKVFNKANKTGLFNEITDSVSWQKQQRNDWE